MALLKDCIDRASASQLGLVDASVRARLEDFTTSSISQHRALRQLQLRAYKAMTKLQVLRGSYADLPGDDDGSDSEDDRPQRPKKAATEPDIEQAYVKARRSPNPRTLGVCLIDCLWLRVAGADYRGEVRFAGAAAGRQLPRRSTGCHDEPNRPSLPSTCAALPGCSYGAGDVRPNQGEQALAGGMRCVQSPTPFPRGAGNS